MQVTGVFQKVPSGYIAFIEEIPGVNTQGVTLEETKANLREALELILATNREMAEETLAETHLPIQRIAMAV